MIESTLSKGFSTETSYNYLLIIHLLKIIEEVLVTLNIMSIILQIFIYSCIASLYVV